MLSTLKVDTTAVINATGLAIMEAHESFTGTAFWDRRLEMASLALVTGGAGFIGSEIARELLSRGWNVRILDDLSTGAESNVPEGAELVVGDLRNLSDVKRACVGARVVFHQGAVTSVPRSFGDPLLYEESNARGTLNVLLASEEVGVERVVYASSSSVYGDVGNGVNKEDMTPKPRSPYGLSKLTGEQYCRIWAESNRLFTVSLRYFNVFGPRQRMAAQYSAIFPAFINALLANRPPTIYSDGEQARDFTSVRNVVNANMLAAEAGDAVNGKTFNIAGGRPRSVNEVLGTVSKVLGRWIDPEYKENRPGDVRKTHADITQAQRALGFRPAEDWEEGVASTVEWFQGLRVPV